MTYIVAWDESVPAGNTDARFLDDRMRDRQTAIRERLCDIFGGLTLLEFQADPIKLKGIRGGGDADFEVLGGTATTSIKGADGANNDLQTDHATGDTTARRDLVAARYVQAAGGFRFHIDGWIVPDVVAGAVATEVIRPQGRALMLRGGSILAVGACLDDTQFMTAGSITVEVWKATITPVDGVRSVVATGLIVTLAVGANRAFNVTTQAIETDTFLAGDELFVKYAASGTLVPDGTLDLRITIEVET